MPMYDKKAYKNPRLPRGGEVGGMATPQRAGGAMQMAAQARARQPKRGAPPIPGTRPFNPQQRPSGAPPGAPPAYSAAPAAAATRGTGGAQQDNMRKRAAQMIAQRRSDAEFDSKVIGAGLDLEGTQQKFGTDAVGAPVGDYGATGTPGYDYGMQASEEGPGLPPPTPSAPPAPGTSLPGGEQPGMGGAGGLPPGAAGDPAGTGVPGAEPPIKPPPSTDPTGTPVPGAEPPDTTGAGPQGAEDQGDAMEESVVPGATLGPQEGLVGGADLGKWDVDTGGYKPTFEEMTPEQKADAAAEKAEQEGWSPAFSEGGGQDGWYDKYGQYYNMNGEPVEIPPAGIKGMEESQSVGVKNQMQQGILDYLNKETGIPDEQLQGQLMQLQMASSEQMVKLAQQMAARGMGASGLTTAGMGQIASQTLAAGENLKFENAKLKVEERLNKMKAYMSMYGQLMSEENRMKIFQEMSALEKEKFKYEQDQDKLADFWTKTNNVAALAQGFDDDALAHIMDAWHNDESAEDAIAGLETYTVDGVTKWRLKKAPATVEGAADAYEKLKAQQEAAYKRGQDKSPVKKQPGKIFPDSFKI